MKKIKLGYLAAAIVVVLVSSCVMKKQVETTSTQITGKKWQLIEVEGKVISEKVNGKMPYLELGTDGNYLANGGCNGIGGTYEWKKNEGIKFSRGMSTMMACKDMSAEYGLQNMFEKADHYRVENNKLIFTQGNGTALAKFKMVAN